MEQSPIGIEPNGRRNVIIVTVDALRKDVVGMQVDGRPVTPELTRLAKAGVSFASATSTYPATLFAMGSAFTGLSPAELYLSPALPDTIFTRSRAQVDRQFAVLPDVSWFRLPIVGQFLAPGVETEFAAQTPLPPMPSSRVSEPHAKTTPRSWRGSTTTRRTTATDHTETSRSARARRTPT